MKRQTWIKFLTGEEAFRIKELQETLTRLPRASTKKFAVRGEISHIRNRAMQRRRYEEKRI